MVRPLVSPVSGILSFANFCAKLLGFGFALGTMADLSYLAGLIPSVPGILSFAASFCAKFPGFGSFCDSCFRFLGCGLALETMADFSCLTGKSWHVPWFHQVLGFSVLLISARNL